MRAAAETDLGSSDRFHSHAAPAERTGLPAGCVDAITCAQSFHWFDRDAARTEFDRILVPRGWVFLIWNERREGAPFEHAYHDILASLGHAFEGIRNRTIKKNLESVFLPGTYREAAFPNSQSMTWKGLRGRFLSSSYVPTAEDPRHAGLLFELERIFRQHQCDGKITLEQDARIYYGQV
jgi:hypothetical protein